MRLIGKDEAVATASPHGVTVGNVPDLAPQAARAALSPVVGKPLTRALIVRMQGELAAVWRKGGFPLVSVTVPPQEITSGVLTLRVVEFHAGTIATQGTTVERNLAGHIRLTPGSRIDAGALEEDLNWLNRNKVLTFDTSTDTILTLLPDWMEGYRVSQPYSGPKFKSPREFIRLSA